MKPVALKVKYAFAHVIAGTLAAGTVMADKPAGAGKGGKAERIDRRDAQRGKQRSERRDDGAQRQGTRVRAPCPVVKQKNGRQLPSIAATRQGRGIGRGAPGC